METIVFYNAGKDAARSGAARIAPRQFDYPVVSRYVEYHTERVNVSPFMQREWLAGYDAQQASK